MSEPTRIYINIEKIEFSGDNTNIVLMDCLRELSKASDRQGAVASATSSKSVEPIKSQPTRPETRPLDSTRK